MVCAKAEKPPLNIVRSWCVWHAVRRDRPKPEEAEVHAGLASILAESSPTERTVSSRSWRVQIGFLSFVFWKIKNKKP